MKTYYLTPDEMEREMKRLGVVKGEGKAPRIYDIGFSKRKQPNPKGVKKK